ncbi:hypothetical protein DSO57_1028041 [Entomophthora muscae]|uniref:Uncharacterized protein n=1 Tax=Entomophthora muscae TaxID=34485 RepID=A0ACC2UBC3_9FUNG|nr:hypothetical protein DSO57_1028041 [Entomophthora muscae]
MAQAKLTSERASLEKDRAKITKLALLLGQEKAQFTKDKEALEKEREQFESMKALDAQDTPQWLLDMDLSRHSLDSLSDDDEEATLAQLLRKGGNISTPTPPSPVKKSRSRQDLDLTNAKSHQNIKSKIPTNKLPLQKPSSRTNSTLTRPTAAALLKAQATQARLIQRRDSKLKQASSITPAAPRIQSTCKTPNVALRTKSKSLSSTNLNLTS